MGTKRISFVRLKVDILIFTEAKCRQHARCATPATLGKGHCIRSIKVTIEASRSIVPQARYSSVASHRPVRQRGDPLPALSWWLSAGFLGHHDGLIKRWRLWGGSNYIRDASFSLLVMIRCNWLQGVRLPPFGWRKIAWRFPACTTWEGRGREKASGLRSLKSFTW